MQTKFSKLEKLRGEINKLQNLRENVSKNKFKIFSDSDLEELDHNIELKESFMPMSAETFNRQFFNKLNSRIDHLTTEVNNLLK